ncbi:MAG: hypothetical protein MUO39_12805, partial [Steroidobacteraceae bacterium]|nr:hypothetical protein [Steroidobacteraceae bacterium]
RARAHHCPDPEPSIGWLGRSPVIQAWGPIDPAGALGFNAICVTSRPALGHSARRRRVMYLAAAVMLGSIVLYLLQQIEDLTS